MSGRTQVVVIETPELGDHSYLVHDGSVAMVVDPQRDLDRVEKLLAEHGVRLTHVFETHLHNDYVTGGLALATDHGAEYVVPAGAEVGFDRTPAADGAVFAVGALTVTAVHTPGHTPHHTSYVVRDESGSEVAFTGGSMLYGAVGRPDLVSPESTRELAHHQWRSVRRLAALLPDRAGVYPTHGFGSFCAATQNQGVRGTIGDERGTNPALLHDEDPFVEQTLAGLDVFPAYYAHMGAQNASGPGPVDLSLPRRADPAELRRRIEAGEWVIDLRSRAVFAEGHLRGTLSFDLHGPFAAYLPWMLPWGVPLTLLGGSAEEVEQAQRELARIGIDRPEAHAVGEPRSWALAGEADIGSYARTDFAGLARILGEDPDAHVIDNRQLLEWQQGHLRGSHHLPFYEVLSRLGEVPADRVVYLYCGSGYRASAVASLLLRDRPCQLVVVDDDWSNAERAGLPIVSQPPVAREPGWTWLEARRVTRTFAPAE